MLRIPPGPRRDRLRGVSDEGGPERRGENRDQEEFQEDPRGREEVSEQQPETQPTGDGDEADYDPPEEQDRDQVGRDDPGEASGNPASAG